MVVSRGLSQAIIVVSKDNTGTCIIVVSKDNTGIVVAKGEAPNYSEGKPM